MPAPSSNPPTSLLFVCLGNICRSPLAKAIFTHQAAARYALDRFHIDSCGTGHWHAGGPADPRTITCAHKHGIRLSHTARQVCTADLTRFDLLLAMDTENAQALLDIGAPPDRVRLIRSFDPALAQRTEALHSTRALDVPDPYIGGSEGFEKVYAMLNTACTGLLDHCLREVRT